MMHSARSLRKSSADGAAPLQPMLSDCCTGDDGSLKNKCQQEAPPINKKRKTIIPVVLIVVHPLLLGEDWKTNDPKYVCTYSSD